MLTIPSAREVRERLTKLDECYRINTTYLGVEVFVAAKIEKAINSLSNSAFIQFKEELLPYHFVLGRKLKSLGYDLILERVESSDDYLLTISW